MLSVHIFSKDRYSEFRVECHFAQHHRKARRTKRKEEKEKREKRRKGLLPEKSRVPMKDDIGWLMHANRLPPVDHSSLAGTWDQR